MVNFFFRKVLSAIALYIVDSRVMYNIRSSVKHNLISHNLNLGGEYLF